MLLNRRPLLRCYRMASCDGRQFRFSSTRMNTASTCKTRLTYGTLLVPTGPISQSQFRAMHSPPSRTPRWCSGMKRSAGASSMTIGNETRPVRLQVSAPIITTSTRTALSIMTVISPGLNIGPHHTLIKILPIGGTAVAAVQNIRRSLARYSRHFPRGLRRADPDLHLLVPLHPRRRRSAANRRLGNVSRSGLHLISAQIPTHPRRTPGRVRKTVQRNDPVAIAS